MNKYMRYGIIALITLYVFRNPAAAGDTVNNAVNGIFTFMDKLSSGSK